MNLDTNMSTTDMQQCTVLLNALNIFQERNRIRGDLWAENSIQDHLRMVDEKLRRIKYNLNGIEEPLDLDVLVDDALDAINFLVFAIREATGKKPDGTSVRS